MEQGGVKGKGPYKVTISFGELQPIPAEDGTVVHATDAASAVTDWNACFNEENKIMPPVIGTNLLSEHKRNSSACPCEESPWTHIQYWMDQPDNDVLTDAELTHTSSVPNWSCFFLNADYHVLKSTVMPPRVVICKVHEKSFRMRYYELFLTNFDHASS